MDSFKTVFVVCVFSIAVTAFKEEHRSSKLTRSPGHVRRGEFPWHVFMSSVKCSGVFIHERWILSSGRCAQLIKDTDSVDQRFIRVGNHHVELDSPGEDEVPVLRALVYPEYAATSSANFGLLYLARSVILSNNQRLPRVNLPSSRLISRLMSLKNRSATKITGWGHFSRRNSPFTTLGEDDALLMPGRDCLQSFPDVGKRKLLEESWCVVAGTAGMCSIDQGSPVVIKQNHSWVVVGVYTYGETCSPDKDIALFSRITAGVLEWIQKLFTVGEKLQCQPSGYRILDTPARALSNQVDFDFPLCDNNLEEAWYKLEIHGIPAEIPTKCPSIGSCGTHAQIWMQPEGHPEFGEEKNGSACVAWEGVKRVCCLWQLPVHVTHCGGFLVYHLKKTEECSTAYCAKEAGRVPCGPGKIGYAPRCKVRDLYPTLADSPQITPVVPPDNILASKSIHLLCSYDVTDPGPSKVSYIVTWYKIVRFFGGTPGKLTLLTNTTEETAIVVNFELAEFTLGDTIVCEVKTFFSESPDQTSPGFSSEDFYVGIKVEPSSLVISENHKMKEISFILTVPLVCPQEHPNCTIQIPMHLVPAVYSPRMLSAADIALSTCEVTMKPQSCSRRDCGRKVVRIVAVSDFINDGERRTRIITEPVRSQSLLWKSHDPADAFVLSKHINTPRCHLFTESYIRTLVGRYYRIPSGVSTFLLYKSKTRPFEVHARFWECSKSRNPGYCACGVAARDGDDVIVIDMCSGRFMETSVQISIKSNLPLAKGIRITEAISGKRYTVYFPSGVYVRTDVFEWGLNVQVQSSGRDLHQVTGLCGLGEVNDFFEETNEGLPPEMNGTHQWRFPDGNSLFQYKPLTERRHQTEKLFCQCSLKDNFEKKKKCETCETKCRRHQHLVWPVMSRERDVTKRVQSLQAGRVLERRNNFSDEFYPLDDKLSYQQTLFDDGKPDTLLAVLAVISYCKRLLTDTPLGRACKPVIGERNMDELLRICIRDMRYTGISSIVWGAAAMLQDSCEDLVLKNTSAWEMTSFIKGLTPPKTVTNAMCPRLCNDRGRCVNGTCKCRRGYTSEDCSVPSKTPPQLISIQNDGECDVRKFLCNHVRVVGEGFQNARDLMCSLAEITENPFETQTFLSKATYESFRGVTCEVPRSHDIDEAIRGYQVRVSNDGDLWSQPLPLFIFDGHCLTCTTQGMRCEIKNGTCRIHGRCRRRGETNPQDPCQWCSPKDSQENWTDIRCHFGTCETSTCVHGVCIDTTMGRYFCFCDEGFTGLNCDVPENSCASNPCGSGTCVQLGSTFRCECPLAYVGVRCLDLINPCSSNPCNNGSCVTNGTHFGCFCDVGFTGRSCETNVQSCLCQHGRCVPQDKNYVCICEVGYTGKFCEVRQDDTCSSLLCGNGSCVERDGNTKCLCDSGYTGGLCDIKIDSCVNPPCTVGNCSSSPCGHRSCFGDNYNFTCACEFGFTGSNCHTTINMTQESKIGETVSNVAVNFHQSSSFNFTFYHVKISIDDAEKIASDKRLSAFDGKDLICHGNLAIIEQFLFYQDQMFRVDENMLLCLLHSVNKTCDCGESVAQENCSCSLSFCNCYSHMEQSKNKSWTPSKSNPCKDGYISCKCFNKYSGLPCDRPVTTKALSKGFVVDCSSELECNGTADPCYPNPCVYGKCSYSEEGIQCLCENGYSGKTCNETSRDSCQPSPCIRGKCQNTEFGFRCVCPKGFYGLTCNQVKTRCSINICSHGDCFIEDSGELLCECFRGYEGPLCESLAVDRCQIGICNNGLCINSRTGFRCLCLSGFSGKRCQVRDLCFPNPCANGNCTSKSDGYHCMCHAGFTGRTCRESVDHCQSRPCVRGQCVNTQDSYLCQCPQGFVGDTCNETVNFCSSNPCLHGDCINLKSSFKCECQEGFQGIVCDKRVVFDPCDKNPCSNGRCISVQAMVRIGPLFYCLCDDGFTGQFCQSQMVPCRNNPCKYGLCVAIDSHVFQCKCFKGFQGSTCETEVNHCISSPCKNGLCIPRNSTFECSCHPGYKGNLCAEVEDKCQPNPCKHGRCHQESTSMQCLCSVGYTGNLCDSRVDHCGSNPCKHGVCVASSIESFKCYCKRGYSGELCDQKVNPCTPNPCKQGSCIHRYSSWFACRCELGYTGKMCEKKIDMCQSQPCKNGVCVNFGMYFRCRCAAGFHGRLCDKIETCPSRPCKRGECIATASSFTCRCPEAYTGRYCENKIDPCQSDPCKNSRCIPVKNTFRCLCNKGYTGELCQVTLKPCSSHECRNGKCIAQGGQYSCQCFKGFSGSYCDVDIDECLISPCFAGVDCINTVGSYSCGPCPVGYTGDGLRCEKLMDPCEMLNCLNGTCIGQGDQYFCQCLQGFSGKRCDIDINECLDSPCFVGVDCTNYPGSYSCGPCPVDFTGDGSHCEKILHPCEKLNCFKEVPCVYKKRKYECGNCPPGFTGNGTQCTEIDACSSSPCHPLVQCFTLQGSPAGFRCGPCPPGYKGNGINCTSLCPLPCPYGMECIGYYTCRCPEGFQGVGCKTPFCRTGCYNGGTCVKPNVCKCLEGFEGPACLSPVCRPPCRYGGECVGPDKCRCPQGFIGPRCEKKRCLVSCLNDGRCIGPYVCHCMPAYSGQRCEIAPCTPRCQNGGLCIARDVCKCPPEYMGERCQFPLCRPPCINDGHCVRPNVCMCPAAWKGDHCQKPVCHLPCLNGGRCARPNQCTCLSGYEGTMCEKAICNQPCLNGGQCVRPGVCACPFGLTGMQCEEKDPWYGNRKQEN